MLGNIFNIQHIAVKNRILLKAYELINKSDYIHCCYILYYRALCYYEIGEYKKAKQDLLSALDCDYDTLKDDILSFINLIHQK